MKAKPIGYDYVDELFDEAADRKEHLRRCPVTGSTFTRDDQLKQIKELARRALAASDWFDRDGPLDYSLPLTYAGREVLKGRFDEGYIVALFARSLASRGWRVDGHIPYRLFVAGVLCLPGLGERILATDASLAMRYPPKPLPGLKPSGVYEVGRKK
jgi:hypothetical protein